MVHPRRRRHQQTAATPMTSSSSSSLLLLILHWLRLCWNYLLSFLNGGNHRGGGNNNTRIISLTNLFQLSSSQRKQLTFDNGTQVTIGEQIAEGGFSYVFEAFPANSSATAKKKYALKRINCADQELLQSCRHEAGIHRSLPSNHPNLLELLGLKFEQDLTSSSSSSSSLVPEEYNVCYMLFPYLPNSLRGEITKRNILNQDDPNDGSNSNNHYYRNNNTQRRQRQPFTTIEVMHLFRGILDALLAMHNANISHRDVKLENVLLSPSSLSTTTTSYADHRHNRRHHSSKYTPILMDYGSAGPLTTPPLTTRHSILNLIEVASTHTTFSYRPPELSDVGNLRPSSSCIVDYGKVDVWSLGCVLFGLLHGASPFEMEFVKNDSGDYGYGRRNGGGREVDQEQYGLVRIVECTTLKILGEVPFPPWAGSGLGGNTNNNNNDDNVGDGSNGKYPLSIYKFIRYMVQHDRMTRPNIYEVAKRFGELHLELMGEEWIPYSKSMSSLKDGGGEEEEREHDDFDSLIASRDFV